EGLGDGANLVELDEDRVGDALLDAAAEALDVGHEQVVADELYFAAELLGEELPAVPIVLVETVLDRNDRELVTHFDVLFDEGSVVDLLAIERVLLGVAIVVLADCAIECERNLGAGLVTGSFDCLDDLAECVLVLAELGSESA